LPIISDQTSCDNRHRYVQELAAIVGYSGKSKNAGMRARLEAARK
jgi:hypothetical protein